MSSIKIKSSLDENLLCLQSNKMGNSNKIFIFNFTTKTIYILNCFQYRNLIKDEKKSTKSYIEKIFGSTIANNHVIIKCICY